MLWGVDRRQVRVNIPRRLMAKSMHHIPSTDYPTANLLPILRNTGKLLGTDALRSAPAGLGTGCGAPSDGSLCFAALASSRDRSCASPAHHELRLGAAGFVRSDPSASRLPLSVTTGLALGSASRRLASLAPPQPPPRQGMAPPRVPRPQGPLSLTLFCFVVPGDN